MRRKSVSSHFKGLLEVEPIHYTCCATSEATRIENMDSLSMQSSNLIDDILIETPPQSQNSVITMIPTLNNIPATFITIPKMGDTYDIITETKKIQDKVDKKSEKKQKQVEKFDLGSANVKTIFDKIFHTQPKKHKYKDDPKTPGTASDMHTTNIQIFTNDEEAFMLNQQSEAKDVSNEILNNAKVNACGSSVYTAKVKEFIEETNKEDNNSFILPWHKLLSTPAKQMIVVDRMHSGARRQVTLDFGYPILLTDLVSCNLNKNT